MDSQKNAIMNACAQVFAVREQLIAEGKSVGLAPYTANYGGNEHFTAAGSFSGTSSKSHTQLRSLNGFSRKG